MIHLEKVYIAIDIGASSGRLMKSQLIEDRLTLEEVHRFKNSFRYHEKSQRWDIDYLIQEILVGLEKLKKSGIEECFIGIDTWAVDYCLIDADGERLGDPVSYRDDRTDQAVEKFSKKLSLEKLYEKTGIQIQPFNTIFQLFVEDPNLLEQANRLLLIPDYLGYILTGKMVTEKTNASTTQLLNHTTQTWDPELLAILGLNEKLFPDLVEAGTILGPLKKAHFSDFDLPNAMIITVATHDTASAIVGTPGEGEDWAYISSGTWSLLGVETTAANGSKEAFEANYTNEAGAYGTIRFLKNIMGMWLIQEVARLLENRYSFEELTKMAAQTPSFQRFIDVNDDRFLNPDDMIQTLRDYCHETYQAIPETPGELARCIYDNLALCYAFELEKLTKKLGVVCDLQKLHIVGGGSNNQLLSQLTADVAGITVEAGPSEATAIGNILVQMVATKGIDSISEGRRIIKRSFLYTIYEPQEIDSEIFEHYQKSIQGADKYEYPTKV